jgi:hypothetical protein
MSKFIYWSFVLGLGLVSYAQSASPSLDAAKIEALTGLKGTMNAKDGVFKVTFPRSDIAAVSHGVRLLPPMGLTAWAAFTRTGKDVMMMGDTVMTEDQVNPVMSVALENGLEVTALHNHFFGDAPKVMFMHIGGMGSEEKLAGAVGKVYAKLKETMGGKGSFPEVAIDPAKSAIDGKKIDDVLGVKGEVSAGVYKMSIGKETKMHGFAMGNAMGVNTWAAFAGTDDRAVVDGDFAVLETELQAVLKALRKADIQIVAIHNHMAMETPRMLFIHYWGVGKTSELAKGLRAALDTQSK